MQVTYHFNRAMDNGVTEAEAGEFIKNPGIISTLRRNFFPHASAVTQNRPTRMEPGTLIPT